MKYIMIIGASSGIGENMPIRLIQTEHIKKMYQIHPMAFIELGKYFSKRKYSNDGSSIVVMSSMAAYEMEKGMADRRICVNGGVAYICRDTDDKMKTWTCGKRRKQSSEIWSDSSQTGCRSDWIFDVGISSIHYGWNCIHLSRMIY